MVAFSRALADTAGRCARAGLALQVVTPGTTRLTWALEELLSTEGARWVVQDGTGPAVDGLRRTPLAWDGSSFAPTGAEPVAAVAAGEGGGVVVDVTVLHPARADLRLGGAVEDVALALTGEPVLGWGVAEPAASRWDREELTRLCRTRAPQRTSLVAVGAWSSERAVVATLSVRRVPEGLLERTRLFAGREVPSLPDLDALAEQLAADYTVRTGLVGLRPGLSDGTVAAASPRVILPVGLLVGPQGVAALNAQVALRTPGGSVRLLGEPARPCCWVRLDPADPGALPRALAHLLPSTG